MSRCSLLFVTLVAASVVTSASGSATRDGLVGDAYDRRGQLRYREVHEFVPASVGTKQVAVYSDPSGREIGRMEADYGPDRFAPVYRMVDYRHDSEEFVRRDGPEVYVEHRVGDKRRSKVIKLDASRPLIVGPGFNEFIRANWQSLLEGRTISCDFVVPNRLQLVAFRIRHTPERPGDPTHRFTVSAENALIRLIAPELVVSYDRRTRSLLSYEGPSNVNDDRNAQQEVVIRFAPPGTGPTQVASGR